MNKENKNKKMLVWMALGVLVGWWSLTALNSYLGQDVGIFLSCIGGGLLFLGYVLSIKKNDRIEQDISEDQETVESKKEAKTMKDRLKIWNW